MARINLEDKLFTDGRFKVFAQGKDEALAIGQMVVLWRLAQTYWLPDRKEIPKSVFDSLKFAQELIQSDLVEVREAGVYVRGSENQFDWWFSKQENGKKGGRPRKNTKKNNPKKADEKLQVSERLADEKLNQSDENPTISLLQSQSQSLNSKNNIFAGIEKAYAEYPRKEGKSKGIEKLKKEIRTEDDLNDLLKAIRNYSKLSTGTDLQFVKHFSSFASCWRDYIQISISELRTSVMDIENPYEFGEDDE